MFISYHLLCEVSVQILWTNIQNYKTLIACLPNESKEILSKDEIIISTSTSKPPLFNYIAFIKILSLNEIIENIHQPFHRFDKDKKLLVTQEIFKMFMNQFSLKKLNYYHHYLASIYVPNLPFPTYPGAIDFLKNLSEFKCESNLYSELFSQLS